MTEIAIQVDNLSKSFRLYTEQRNSLKERFVRGSGSRYHDFFALRDVSFEVERGTTFGLIGHNGSGKSTLLKMLAGIYRPTAGSIRANGRISALLELGAGFHGELSGRENVYLNGAILGLSRKQIDAAMDEIIDFAGIGDFIDSPVKVYSSGMYVRLGFSIAVTSKPEILIVDEIIAVGDEEFQRKCFEYLYKLRHDGTTIVLVSHSLGLMADLCDQAVWLDHGSMQASGDVHDVVDAYLHSVNEKEALAGAAEGVAGNSDTRTGSGEIRVQDIEYLNGRGETVPFLMAAEPCTVRIHYSAQTPLAEVVFGLSFVHESGINVAGPNSGYGDSAFKVDAGIGFVDFEMPEFALQPGVFRVTTAIVDRGHTYDYQDRQYELRVRSDTASVEPGMTKLFGSWSIRQGVDR